MAVVPYLPGAERPCLDIQHLGVEKVASDAYHRLSVNANQSLYVPCLLEISVVLSIAMFITTFVGLLVRSSPKASNIFVWDTFINTTGWPDGVCFITGLLTPAFMYGGLDGSLHLAEEAQNPRKVVPRVCVGVIVVGFCTACPFAITILYSISDFEAIVTSSGYVLG